MGILEEQQFRLAQLATRLEKLEQEQFINTLLLDEMVKIPATRVMKMNLPGLKSWTGLNSAEAKGELVIDKSGKPARIGAKSLADYIRKHGYTLESLKERMVAA